jgi:anti-anti-sigma regulatory factor
MIKTARKRNVLSVRLSAESTIACVEADTRLLNKKLTGLENLGKIEVDGAGVEEMDTAYLQLLVSLSLTAEIKGIEFLVCRPSERFRELAALYGLRDKDLRGRDSCPGPL